MSLYIDIDGHAPHTIICYDDGCVFTHSNDTIHYLSAIYGESYRRLLAEYGDV